MGDVSLRYLLFGEDRSASKTIKGVGDAAESTAGRMSGMVGRISQAIGGDMGELLSRAGDGLGVLDDKGDKLGKRLMAVGSVATGAGIAMQQMASGDVEAHNALVNAVENSGKSYDDFAEQIDSAIASQVAFGNTDGEVQAALTKLTDATHDPTKALGDLQLATDLAAAKGIGLSEAAALIGKAHNGSTKVFKEFGVVVGQNADGSANYEGALSDLAGTLSGRAAASQDSFAGKLREGRAWLDNAASGFAEQYGPAITAAGAALTGLSAVLELAKVAQIKTTAATVAGKIAQGASAAATGVATAAQWLWNAALNANPIGLVIVGIAAFVAAILWLWNNVDWFREGVIKAWDAIKTGWSFLWDNVLKPGINAFGAAFRWLWNTVLAPTIRLIIGGFATITEWIANMLDALGNIPGFEWAKTAGQRMHEAAGRAKELADNIRDIPEDVPVNVTFSATTTAAFRSAMDGISNSQAGRLNAKLVAAGGYITGPGTSTSDSIPAWLSNGEYVLSAATVARVGVRTLDALNSGHTVAHLAGGGPVGASPAATAHTYVMPSTVVLRVGDREFTAYVDERAESVLAREAREVAWR